MFTCVFVVVVCCRFVVMIAFVFVVFDVALCLSCRICFFVCGVAIGLSLMLCRCLFVVCLVVVFRCLLFVCRARCVV